MNGRVVLVGLAVAVLGAAIYFFAIRGGDDAGGGDRTTANQPGQPDRDVPDRTAPERTPGKTIPADPDTAPTAVEHVREDGTTVRDHRKNPGEYVRPSLPHPDESPVTGEVTASVMSLVRPAVLACLKDLPEAAYGARPVVMTRATISIDEQGTMTIDELGPAVTDIDESAASAALDCIRAKSGTLTAHVDHAAVATANLAFPIRPLDYRRDKPPSK